MKSADDFYVRFASKIAEIHLSGYSVLHDPIFQTKQVEIIKAVKSFNLPIIIESYVSLGDLEKERNYILEVISSIKR